MNIYLFIHTDVYAFVLSYFAEIVDMITIYRTVPLIIMLPIGVFIGNKFLLLSIFTPKSSSGPVKS